MKNKFLLIAFFILGTNCFAQFKLAKSDMVKIDFTALEKKKVLVQQKDKSVLPAYAELMKSCNKLLSVAPYSVMEKKDLPPSGNKHDYMSIAPYWWPDPAMKDGVPYMRKDGEVNPETANYLDKVYMGRLCENVQVLALGYYFSNDQRFAKKATELIKVWFLDTATRMNPNMNFGQAVKGRFTGRAEGMIDCRLFIFMLDGIQMIKNSEAWTPEYDAQLKQWFRSFLTWMQSSEIGKDELHAKNNHGIWYDAQELCYSLYVGDETNARKVLDRNIKRMDQQMNAEGFFPLELERTTSLHYSVFILHAFEITAKLAQQLNFDLWHYTLPDGRSLQKSFAAILPYLKKEKEWKLQQIKPFEEEDGYPLLLSAFSKYGCTDCIKSIENKNANLNVLLMQLY